MINRIVSAGFLLALTALSQYHFEPSEKVPGIGVRQKAMSPETLKLRERGIVDAMKFYIATQPPFMDGVERVTGDKLQNVFAIASSNSGFPSVWLEAIALLESWGKNDVKSPTGPVGLFQFTRAAGTDEGLFKKRIETRNVVQMVGKGKKKRTRTRQVKVVIIEDLRTDLQSSANAAARRLKRMQETYGGKLDWAVGSHHAGPGNILSWVQAYAERKTFETQIGQILRINDLSYPKFFFSCSPLWRRNLYNVLQSKMNAKDDYSPTYYFRVQAALELINWYRMDKEGLKDFVKKNRNKYKPGEPAPSRMYAMLDHGDFFLKALNDLKNAQGKELARVPDRPKVFGYYLRRLGLHPIGEADLANQDDYLYLRPASIGALMSLAYDYHLTYEQYKHIFGEKPKFSELDVSSLLRTWESQIDLKNKIGNKTAHTGWPTHTTAWAFDIAAAHMTKGQKECLKYILQSYEWMGLIGFVEEKVTSTAYHILPTPQGREYFTRVYLESKDYLESYLAKNLEPEIPRGTEFEKARKVASKSIKRQTNRRQSELKVRTKIKKPRSA